MLWFICLFCIQFHLIEYQDNAESRQKEKHEVMNKNVLLVYIFYVLYECIEFHSIEYQDNAEYILLIYFSFTQVI